MIFTMTMTPGPTQGQSAAVTGHVVSYGAPGRRISGRVYTSKHVSAHPRLIVVVHGDAPEHNPTYQYGFAQTAADELDDTVVLAILRPGYRDDSGARSDGDRGLSTGDNYTADAADRVRAAIDQAALAFHPRQVVLVGHSGGAALVVIMLAQQPGLAPQALIASCPCDLPAWRLHMAFRTFNPLFLLPVRSVSPLAQVTALSPRLKLRVVVGERDKVAPPSLSRRFVAAAHKRGLDAQLTIVPGADHEVLQNPAILLLLKTML
jgi:pimeloyl-ACP methyl ester carboxylesterase